MSLNTSFHYTAREVYLILWAEQLPCLSLPEPTRLHCSKTTYYTIKKQWMPPVCPQNRCFASLVPLGTFCVCEKMYSIILYLFQILWIALSTTFSEEKSEEIQGRLLYCRLFWSLICCATWNSFHWHLLILDQALVELIKCFSSTIQQKMLSSTWELLRWWWD